jgi:hypothetical protein
MPRVSDQHRHQVLKLVAWSFDVLAEEFAVEDQDARDLSGFVEGPGCFDDLRNAGGVSSGGKLALVEKAFEQIVAQAFLAFI